MLLLGLAILLLAGAVLVHFAVDPAGLVVVRNALLAQPADRAAFEWTPESLPADFKQARGPMPASLAPIAAQVIGGRGADSLFAKALAIAAHLREFSGDGEGIHSDTEDAYWKIRRQNTGYCADYTQVFTGLAYAAQISTREWAISWKEWGKGHAFNEIYDPALKKWILIDSFNSLYMVDAQTRSPLSTLDVYDRLTASTENPNIEVVPIVPGQFQFKNGAMALDYYRAGINELSLWWGADVFSLDSSVLVRWSAKVSHVLEPIVAVLVGAQPRLKLLATERNASDVKELSQIKTQFLLAIVATLLGLVLIAMGLSLWARDRRRARLSMRARVA